MKVLFLQEIERKEVSLRRNPKLAPQLLRSPDLGTQFLLPATKLLKISSEKPSTPMATSSIFQWK